MAHVESGRGCRWELLTGFLVLGSIVGCNGGSDRDVYPVKGKITWEGAPVTIGRITFRPTDGGRPASGKIQPDGSYELTSFSRGDGAKPGEYRVGINALRKKSASAGAGEFSAEVTNAKQTWLVPEEYSEPSTSGLTATVETDDNVIDFALP